MIVRKKILDMSCIKQKAGFTLLETAISVAIIALVGALSLVSFVNSRRARDLVIGGQNVLSVSETARVNASAGHDASQWGVHLEQYRIVLFRGTAYADATVTTPYPLPSTVEIADADIALTGGGRDVIFKRISGATDQAGTFIVRVRGSATQTFPITVDPSGTAYRTGVAPVFGSARITDARHRAFAFNWNMQSVVTLTLNFNDGELVYPVAMAPYFNAEKSIFDWSGIVSAGGQNQTLRIHTILLTPTNAVLHLDRDCRKNTKKLNIAIDGKGIATYEADCRIVAVGAFGGVMSEP